MKKKDLPQDKSSLEKMTRELCYVKNKKNKYEAQLSKGWKVKTDALKSTWDFINEEVKLAHRQVSEGEKSPVYYFFVLKLMDFQILKSYTGFWKFQIKKHMTKKGFEKLNEKKLAKYAAAFDISIEELINFK